MQRSERRMAERDSRAVRTLAESDYLLGVADETRLGALRFRWLGDEETSWMLAKVARGSHELLRRGRSIDAACARCWR
jgi:serine/threonine-protein kinase HipA